MSLRLSVLLLLLLVILLPVSALSASPSSEPANETASDSNSLVRSLHKTWQRVLSKNEANIARGDWNKVTKQIGRLLERMDRLVVREFQEETGVALLQRAVAEAALGESAKAKWSLAMAEQFIPDASQRLSHLGEPGETLEALGDGCDDGALKRKSSEDTAPESAKSSSDDPDDSKHLITAADIPHLEILKQSTPVTPRAVAELRIPIPVEVAVDVDTSGIPHCPRIVHDHRFTTLLRRDMAALRTWRFQPARIADVVMPYTYTLTLVHRE